MVPLKLLKENIYTHHLFDTLQIGVVKVEAHFQIEFQSFNRLKKSNRKMTEMAYTMAIPNNIFVDIIIFPRFS